MWGTFCEVSVICTLFHSGSKKSRAEPRHYERALCVRCGPMQGKPAECLAHPDHHRGQTGYVSLILYLTETKSIVSPLSGFMCVWHIKEVKKRECGKHFGYKFSKRLSASLWSKQILLHNSNHLQIMMFFNYGVEVGALSLWLQGCGSFLVCFGALTSAAARNVCELLLQCNNLVHTTSRTGHSSTARSVDKLTGIQEVYCSIFCSFLCFYWLTHPTSGAH